MTCRVAFASQNIYHLNNVKKHIEQAYILTSVIKFDIQHKNFTSRCTVHTQSTFHLKSTPTTPPPLPPPQHIMP